MTDTTYEKEHQTLKEKLRRTDAVVGIYGLGYVGLPLLLNYHIKGFKVIGFEVDPRKIQTLNNGSSYVDDIKNEKISEALKRGNISFTTDFSKTKELDVVIICVPTPLNDQRYPDVTYIKSAVQSLVEHLKDYRLVVLESTTYPGTTRELVYEPLKHKKPFVSFSPERISPGDSFGTDVTTIPKVVSGINAESLDLCTVLYGHIIKQLVPVHSVDEAEMVKLVENTFRVVNIALVNELCMLCDKMNIDIWSVIEAAKTKPYGFMPFYPGPGVGGHCIPLDPLYLAWKAKGFDFTTHFINLATQINDQMPHYLASKVKRSLVMDAHHSSVLVVGVTYKKDISDARESPALKVISELISSGIAKVNFYDPHVETLKIDGKTLQRITNFESSISTYDALVICTDHTCLDWVKIAKEAKLIIDARNVIRKHVPDAKNVIPL
eukprot:TRINITY_DN7477_c0_g1_i1.p1 TRINITY_DN7477_c0_g1~~TRINITY_DN7477_c0_g1_i1.p1  ORF type:complete len:447 (-),score=65.55 TRINITY_DN7477_c0_g1_i1:17-1327(-)